MTTGYSQFIPEFKIVPNAHYLLGFKIYPLNDLVGALPVTIYNAYENSNVYPISSAFAAALVLITIVLLINLSAKILWWYTEGGMQNSKWVKKARVMLPGSKPRISETGLGPMIIPVMTDMRKDSIHSASSEKTEDSDWRLVTIQPVSPAVIPAVTSNVSQSVSAEKIIQTLSNDQKPGLGRNEENRPNQLPWWKRLIRNGTDTSDSLTNKDSGSSSLHTTSGISAMVIAVKSLINRQKKPEPPLKEKLQTDAKLASLIGRERELDDLFEGDSERALLDRLPENKLQTKFHTDARLQSLFQKEQELDRFLENNRESQPSNDIRTIVYTENGQEDQTGSISGQTGETRVVTSGEINPRVFSSYSRTSEEFAFFEERPLDMPESNYSAQDHDRWRLMHRNREENTFL